MTTMSETKHTPEKWRYESLDGRYARIHRVLADDAIIANFQYMGEFAEQGESRARLYSIAYLRRIAKANGYEPSAIRKAKGEL